MRFDLVGSGYLGRSAALNASRCVNLYPEVAGPDSKNVAALIGTPGTSIFCDTSLSSIRGVHVFNGLMYIVASNKLYSVTTTSVLSAQLGSNLTTSTGRVVMADNGLSPTGGNDLIIADGAKLYNYDVITTTWTEIATAANTVCFIGGVFVADIGGGRWQASGLYDGTSWSGLDISTADSMPDSLLAVYNNHNELWFFGEYTIEIWYQSGSGNPPFARMSGGSMDYGCAARFSIAKGNNSVLWLATIRNEKGGDFWGVAMASGYAPQKISTPAIDYQISQYATISDAFGFCYTDGGHEFYMLTFPTQNVSWCYDISTGFWHERSAYQGSMYATGRHVSNCCTYFNNKHYVGDYNSGKIYEMSSSLFDDSGTAIASWRTTAYVDDKEDLNNIFFKSLQIDAEVGVRIGKRLVAVSAFGGNSAGYSDDGINWTASTLPANGTWITSVFNDNFYCAIMANSSIAATSSNGINWTQRVLPANDAWWAAASTGKRMFVVGLSANALTTEDAITWSNASMPASRLWVAIASNGSGYVAVAQNSNAAAYTSTTSPYPWSAAVLPANTSWRGVASNGNGYCAIVYGSNVGAISSTGANWTQTTLPVQANWNSIASNGKGYCAVALGSNIAAISNDGGSTWTQTTLPTSANWSSICHNTVYYCTVAMGSNIGAISVDGVNWTQVVLSSVSDWYSVIFGGVVPYNPQIYLSWSDDGGNTFTSDIATSLGTYQAYITRAKWYRLGKSRRRIFRISCDANIKKVFIAAHIDVARGNT